MRPQILFPLFAPSANLKGVGPRTAPLLEKLAGPLVRDVLFLGPQNLVHRPVVAANQARDGEIATLHVTIDAHLPPQRSNQPYRIRTFDGTAFLTLIWFKVQGDHLLRSHPVGAKRAVSGKVDHFGSELQMAHPDYLLPIERAGEIPTREAVYPATAGLPPRTVRKLALEALERAADLPEWQDPAFLARELPRLARGPGPPPCAGQRRRPLSPRPAPAALGL